MISRALGAVLCALALAATALYVKLALGHLRYPGELDYIEGVMLDHVVRMVQGKPLYVAPSLSFITLAYMPGFTFVASLVARVLGISFLAGRLVSFGCSLVVALLAGAIVRRETREWTFAAAATGLYVMGYGIAGGGHYDVARPDSLMLALSLGALMLLRFSAGRMGAVGAALLLAAAFFTKQHAVWFGIAAVVHMALNDRPRFVPFALTWAVGCAGGYGLLSAWLGPWFSYYTWNLPAHWSTFSPLRIEHYVGAGLFGMLGPLTVATLLSLGLPESPWRGRGGLWAWLGLAGFGTGMLATLDPSAWRHVFIPSMMAFSVLGPLSMHRLATHFGQGSPATGRRARAAVYVLLILQFVPLIYSTSLERPHRGAAAARATLVDAIRRIPGPVIVVEHGFFAWTAGKGPALQQIAFGDLERSHGDRLHRADPAYLEKLLAPLRSGPNRPTLITDEAVDQVGPLWNLVAPGYRLTGDLGMATEPLHGFAGHAAWPRYIYSPVDSSSTPTAGGGAAAKP